MATRAAGTFYDTMTVMSILATSKEGMTKGAIQREMKYITVGQVGRIIATLAECGFVYGDVFKHGRTGKVVYRLTEAAAIYCASIAREYTEKH